MMWPFIKFTRPDDNIPDESNGSPTLMYHKWHAYDSFISKNEIVKGKTVQLKEFDIKETRTFYLSKVSNAIKNINAPTQYKLWYDNYTQSMQAIGSKNVSFTTLWRLVIGMGTNSALETGLTLHHLYGFPLIPGSAIKGLLHHYKELELMPELEAAIKALQTELPPEVPDGFEQAIKKCEFVKVLFGSLCLESNESCPDLSAPKELLKYFQKEKLLNTADTWNQINKRIEKLINENTAGILCFYDAVPSEEEATTSWIDTDIINPHYPEYYQEGVQQWPSDDQNPKPIYFLAIKPGVTFSFFYKIKNNPNIHHSLSDKDIIDWLKTALGEYGVGSKTAAGYGYMLPVEIKPTNSYKMEKPPTIESTLSIAEKLVNWPPTVDRRVWETVAACPHIRSVRITGQACNLPALPRPKEKFLPKGDKISVKYCQHNILIDVEVTLQGVKGISEANYIWHHVILKELQFIHQCK